MDVTRKHFLLLTPCFQKTCFGFLALNKCVVENTVFQVKKSQILMHEKSLAFNGFHQEKLSSYQTLFAKKKLSTMCIIKIVPFYNL